MRPASVYDPVHISPCPLKGAPIDIGGSCDDIVRKVDRPTTSEACIVYGREPRAREAEQVLPLPQMHPSDRADTCRVTGINDDAYMVDRRLIIWIGIYPVLYLGSHAAEALEAVHLAPRARARGKGDEEQEERRCELHGQHTTMLVETVPSGSPPFR